jgi:hypothetical protein
MIGIWWIIMRDKILAQIAYAVDTKFKLETTPKVVAIFEEIDRIPDLIEALPLITLGNREALKVVLVRLGYLKDLKDL